MVWQVEALKSKASAEGAGGKAQAQLDQTTLKLQHKQAKLKGESLPTAGQGRAGESPAALSALCIAPLWRQKRVLKHLAPNRNSLLVLQTERLVGCVGDGNPLVLPPGPCSGSRPVLGAGGGPAPPALHPGPERGASPGLGPGGCHWWRDAAALAEPSAVWPGQHPVIGLRWGFQPPMPPVPPVLLVRHRFGCATTPARRC